MSETIEKLEGVAWDEPEYDSYLVTTCHQLRKKPIDEFGVEDLRVMIGQNIGTEHLMPRALELLEQDPLIWDYHYPGELLQAVLNLPDSYWKSHPDHLNRTRPVAEQAIQKLKQIWAGRKENARRDYGAELDEEACRDHPEGDVLRWAQTFLSKHQAI